MTLSAEWRALQREAQLAAEQIAAGITVLGRANHAQTGLYFQGFFGLSIGLERLGKLVIVADYAINNGGRFLTDTDLRRVGHDLLKILPRCEAIGAKVAPNRAYAPRPKEDIHEGIEQTLSDFAIKTRYYNLNYITGTAGQQTDPVQMWWERVGLPVCERHYSQRKRGRDQVKSLLMQQMLGGSVSVLHHKEDGSEINSVRDIVGRVGPTAVVQKYGRLYTLQIVRWLASILGELSYLGAYQHRIEALLGLNEPFILFANDDQFLRDRKRWSIYRP